MEIRSLFKSLFSEKEKQQQSLSETKFKLLNDFTPTFTNFSGELYDSDIVRSTIHAIASNAAKLKPKHIRRTQSELVATNSSLERLLQVRPNKYMNTYDFLYKTVTQLFTTNNAFIFIQIEKGKIIGFYPINYSMVELVEVMGEMYAKFSFMGGQKVTLPYTELIHLRRHFNKHDIYGEASNSVLDPTLQLINTSNQGIINAVKSSAYLRGLLKFTQSLLKPEDMKKERDRFVTDYMDINNNGGVAALDAKADYIEIKNDPKMADDKQMALIRDNVYRFFNVSEKIVTSSYSEDEWNAFYESVIEPIAIQLSLEFTSKVFTDKEIGFGNEIVFEANRLQYASAKTKISLIKELIPFGLFTINEAREIFNLPPELDGDKRIQTLNVVDASKANEYQLGSDPPKGGEGIDNQEGN